jgi:hypothetical protein
MRPDRRPPFRILWCLETRLRPQSTTCVLSHGRGSLLPFWLLVLRMKLSCGTLWVSRFGHAAAQPLCAGRCQPVSPTQPIDIMGIFTKRKAQSPSVEIPTGNGAVSLPSLDLEHAASVIEARQRGNMARKKTTGLKAHRDMAADQGFMGVLAKCLPCLQSASK